MQFKTFQEQSVEHINKLLDFFVTMHKPENEEYYQPEIENYKKEQSAIKAAQLLAEQKKQQEEKKRKPIEEEESHLTLEELRKKRIEKFQK